MWQENYQEWQAAANLEPNLKKELAFLKEEEREERFYQHVAFGTGGMRGELGVGTNRINIYTIRRVSQALADYISSLGESAKQAGVVISYDNRHYSKEFGEETAKILAESNIRVYLSDAMRPTPELSFLVREWQATAGVMITASHNPAQYNGYKIYDHTGGQITLELAELLANRLENSQNELALSTKKIEAYLKSGLISYYGKEADQLYLAQLKTVTQQRELLASIGGTYPIVYSPLHGTGLRLIEAGLKQVGCTNLQIVQTQADGDPDFSTVVSPNPEEHAAFEQAIALGNEKHAALLLVTDPDADRLGVAVRKAGEYHFLNGNQLGVLLLDYLLPHDSAQNRFIVKTIVTSDLGKKIAADYQVSTIETLTGFKFIGEQITLAEKKQDAAFLFGYEESFGYLIKPFVRDKDAVQTALLTAEMVLVYQQQQKNILDVLEEIYQKYGYYKESLHSYEFKGQHGQVELHEKMKQLRQNPIEQLAESKVQSIEDYLAGTQLNCQTQEKTELALPQSDVLKYIFEENSWICVRPSGTEPKCKIYFSTHNKVETVAQNKLEEMEQQFLKRFTSEN